MKKRYKNEWVKIGHCGVDSGQLLIIDPCYLSEWKDGDALFEKDKIQNDYDECCKITCNYNLCAGEHSKLGVVFASGYGDGNYPVMAFYNEDSRITEIKILMD